MNEISIPEELSALDQSIYLARHITNAVDILRPLVYKVWKENLWEGRFSSFGEYIESPEGLGKSQGYASKLRNVEEHYVIDGGLSQENIAGIDTESLYLAARLPGTPEEQVAMARTLTRRELKETANDDTPCEHEIVRMCRRCSLRVYEADQIA